MSLHSAAQDSTAEHNTAQPRPAQLKHITAQQECRSIFGETQFKTGQPREHQEHSTAQQGLVQHVRPQFPPEPEALAYAAAGQLSAAAFAPEAPPVPPAACSPKQT